jgi:hypothetical protein
MTASTSTELPSRIGRLETPTALELAELQACIEELQTVLACCERLVTVLADPARDATAVEGFWTLALLSYARCFAPGTGRLTEADLKKAQPHGDVLEWHHVLMRLSAHHAHASSNPRERFTVGVVRDAQGVVGAIAVTSARQPNVDLLTVRQTGAIAFALSTLADERTAALQASLFTDAQAMSASDLDRLATVELDAQG